jgi:SAM-dependent MidA family methyltransferase
LTATPLKSLLLETLRREGPVPFERYMWFCLYHPEFGYYTRGAERTGARGDYFTSPDLHPIFARLMARQAAEMWELAGRPRPFTWVELGAGRGFFAREFLDWTRRALPAFDSALGYVAVEPSPKTLDQIRRRFEEGGLAHRVRLLPSVESLDPVSGCFFSNELLDAFPVAVVTRSGGRLREIYVEASGEDLREKTGPLSDPAIAAAVARYAKQLEEGERVEVNRGIAAYAQMLGRKLALGFAVTIDYGDLAQKLYTPGRPRGTLLAYRRHAASENFYAFPGEQDLTAHVNFSALMDAGKEAALDVTGFTTQERFLMALGETNRFADLFEQDATEMEKLQARLKLKRLIHPGGMGSIFKVLIQRRGVAEPRLTGLRYARPWQ